MSGKVRLKIKRQDDSNAKPYWDYFEVDLQPNMNIISALMQIRLNPYNLKGEKVRPVTWDCSCLEEVCGACTMIINGKVRQACSALVKDLERPVVLEPLKKFPVVADLMVDRQVIFDNLKRVHAWIDIDGTYDVGPGPRIDEKQRQFNYQLARCMSCGCCLEACPQYNGKTSFLGAAILAQVYLFNHQPLGASYREERLNAIMGPGGIADCGNAQNCVRACPKDLPLTEVIGRLNRETFVHGLKRWLEEG